MISANVKKALPFTVKHPLQAATRWYWALRKLPAQSLMDLSIFKSVLSQSASSHLRVFEWGAGRSSIFYPRFLKSIGRDFEWYAMDNSREWFERCRAGVDLSGLKEQVHLECSAFPPFWDLPGYTHEHPVPPEALADEVRKQLGVIRAEFEAVVRVLVTAGQESTKAH